MSSVFNGMENERNCLSRQYWPRLKSVLFNKGILMRVVDLRWGITSEMSSDHQTINTCLREIDRSDIFVGLYGQRYGWHGKDDEALQKNMDRAAEAFPWVEQYRDRSATEMEFLHGHINKPGQMPACFAFRNPQYDEQVSRQGKEAGDEKKERSYKSEDGESYDYINALRRNVSESENDTIGVILDYDNPEEGAEFIYKSIRKYIDDEILADHQEPVSQWERSQQAHDIFMKSRAGAYVGGEEYEAQLNQYVSQEGVAPPLLVIGATGCGKTALLSNWLKNRRDSKNNDIVISHFVGADPKSSNPVNLVRRLIGNTEYNLTGKMVDVFKLKDDAHELVEMLKKSLLSMEKELTNGKRLIIIVDMVDQFSMKKTWKKFFWLPKPLPANVRMIFTSAAASTAETLEFLQDEHNAVHLEIGPLKENDKRALCDILLEQYSKSLESDQLEMIITSPKTSQPLFLRTLLTELCVLGKFRQLNEQIEKFLQCEDVAHLLGLVLQRMEREYDHPDYSGSLVKDILCAICLCNRGISEIELPMPQYMWTPVIYAMTKYLINRFGLLSFAFPEMKTSVEMVYLSSKDDRTKAAKNVAEIFYQPYVQHIKDNTPLPKRIAIELPHLLKEAEDHDRLMEVVSNIKVFEVLYKSAPFDLNDNWQWLVSPGDVIARRYLRSLDCYVASRYATHLKNMNSEATTHLMNWKIKILQDVRRWMETSRLYTGMEVVFEREIVLITAQMEKSDTEFSEDLFIANFDKASFLANTGRYTEALNLNQDVLENGEKLVEAEVIQKKDIAKCYNALGRCCYKLDRLENADNWYKLAIDTLNGESTKKQDLAWVYYNLGMTHDHQGDYETALTYFQNAVSLWEEIEPNSISLGAAVNSLQLGSVYQKQNDFDKAEAFFKKAMDSCKKLLGHDSIDVAKCLNSMGLLEKQKNNHWESVKLVNESVRIFKLMAPKGYHRTIHAEETLLAELLQLGDYEKAEPIIDSLVQDLMTTGARTNSPDIYVKFIEGCLDRQQFTKAAGLASTLLKTSIESDTILSQLLRAKHHLSEGQTIADETAT